MASNLFIAKCKGKLNFDFIYLETEENDRKFILDLRLDECDPKNICRMMFDLGVNILLIEYFEWFVKAVDV